MAGDIVTASGSKLFIGPATTNVTDTLAEFQSITAWTEIGLIENLGELGDEASSVTGAAIGDSRIRKAKGARDAGTMSVICFHDPTDTGQAAVEAAEQTNDNYAFKLIIADGPPGYSDTTKYFRGLVMGRRQNVGTNDNIIRNTYNIGVNSPLVIDVASTP